MKRYRVTIEPYLIGSILRYAYRIEGRWGSGLPYGFRYTIAYEKDFGSATRAEGAARGKVQLLKDRDNLKVKRFRL